MKNEEYLLGSSAAEIERLGFQNEVWRDATGDLWREAGISLGGRVVDLGCGPGFCTFDLSRLVGSQGRVFAVDSSPRFASLMEMKIEAHEPANVSFRRADATDTGLDDGSADFVFARWLFCFLKDPAAALGEIRRVLRPGGRLIVLDYFNYLAADVFPRNEHISELFRGYQRLVTEAGGSYDIGEILPGLMMESGFGIETLSPVCRIARPGTRLWKWVELFNAVSVPVLVERGLWSAEQKENFERAWQKAAGNPAAFFYTPPMIGIIARKPA